MARKRIYDLTEDTTPAADDFLVTDKSGLDEATKVNVNKFLLADGATTAAKLVIDQSNATGAIPVLSVKQQDVTEEFIRFTGTSAADNTQSLADAADLEDPGAIAGWLKIYIVDDAVSGAITDGVYWIPFYATPTHSP